MFWLDVLLLPAGDVADAAAAADVAEDADVVDVADVADVVEDVDVVNAADVAEDADVADVANVFGVADVAALALVAVPVDLAFVLDSAFVLDPAFVLDAPPTGVVTVEGVEGGRPTALLELTAAQEPEIDTGNPAWLQLLTTSKISTADHDVGQCQCTPPQGGEAHR